MDNATHQELVTRHENALATMRSAEARNLSDRTQARRWREVFAAEDALKAFGGWA